MALQGIRDISKDTPSKNFSKKKTGLSAKQWAQILGVKLPTLDPNAMDTCADRSHSFFKNKGSKGCAGTTREDPETQRKEGRSFTCNKKGHLARNCPDKPTKKSEGKVKARSAKTEANDSKEEAKPQTMEEKARAVIQLGRSMKEEEKLNFLIRVIEADKGAECHGRT